VISLSTLPTLLWLSFTGRGNSFLAIKA